ncbi:hypothetical protein MPSEU_000006400 [Mayamaea pseudoterrestris]|nr:hypothetical protein MPSEU_000006400 [Mayamaea pseudoterrestris]
MQSLMESTPYTYLCNSSKKLVAMFLLVATARQHVVRAWSTSSRSCRIPASLHHLSRHHYLVPTTYIKSMLHSTTDPTTESIAATLSTDAASSTSTTKRLSRQDLSLDLKTIDAHLDVVLSHLHSRQAPTDAVMELSQLTAQRSQLIMERDDALHQRKQASATVGQLLAAQQKQQKVEGSDNDDNNENNDNDTLLEQAKQQSQVAALAASNADTKLVELQARMDDLLAGVPNLLDDMVPNGKDETSNVVVKEWGDVKALPKRLQWNTLADSSDWEPLWHDDVASNLQGYMAEAAVKISGARFVALSGSIARLERALAMFMMDMHVNKGYTEVTVPYVVGRSALEGTSQLPKFEQDLFAISPSSHTCNGEDAFLIPTAEVPVTNLHRNDILEASDLPIKYVSYTPCFRAEAGSYGRDTKGLIRTHQFHKVELVKITSAESSNDEHEALTEDAEAILQALELPYRKMRLCSGDIGFAARHCYDLEVWLPGAKEYREISSCSNCGDFQARRMSLRYRPAAGDDEGTDKKAKKPKKVKPQLCHTINGSGLAVGRTLVAVLENYQRPDGSVVVPTVLRPYMGGMEVMQAPK